VDTKDERCFLHVNGWGILGGTVILIGIIMTYAKVKSDEREHAVLDQTLHDTIQSMNGVKDTLAKGHKEAADTLKSIQDASEFVRRELGDSESAGLRGAVATVAQLEKSSLANIKTEMADAAPLIAKKIQGPIAVEIAKRFVVPDGTELAGRIALPTSREIAEAAVIAHPIDKNDLAAQFAEAVQRKGSLPDGPSIAAALAALGVLQWPRADVLAKAMQGQAPKVDDLATALVTAGLRGPPADVLAAALLKAHPIDDGEIAQALAAALASRVEIDKVRDTVVALCNNPNPTQAASLRDAIVLGLRAQADNSERGRLSVALNKP
jgi:hypothetical protein